MSVPSPPSLFEQGRGNDSGAIRGKREREGEGLQTPRTNDYSKTMGFNPWAGLSEDQREARKQKLRDSAKRQWTDERRQQAAEVAKARWTPEARQEAAEAAKARFLEANPDWTSKPPKEPKPRGRRINPDSKSARLDFGSRQANGRLTLYERVSRPDVPPSSTMWLAKCDCGRWAGVRADRFIAEKTRSCGCLAIRAAERAVSRAQGRLRKAEATVVERHAIMARIATEKGYN